MAQRRMFAKTIVDSDAFLDMPMSSQLLYFHLSVRADDDGFVNKPKTVMRMVRSTKEDIDVLISKKFIISFPSGVIVIKHWHIHNYIQKDRYTETKYKDEKSHLQLDNNKAYKLMDTECVQVGHEMETQVRLELGKSKVSKDIVESKELDITVIKEIVDYLNKVCERSYRYTSGKTKTLIKSRFNEGFTIDDFKKVIDIKNDQWGNDNKMKEFLRPETLFGTKFESYLQQPKSMKQQVPEFMDDKYKKENGKSPEEEKKRMELLKRLRGKENE